MEPFEITPQEHYTQELRTALSIIQMRYNEKLQEEFAYNEYFLKPMFIDKYTKAYDMGLDDKELGIETPMVNLSVYNSEHKLINMDITFEEFKGFYRAVKEVIKPIETKYQQYLAEIDNLPTLERLDEIIRNNDF